MAQRSLAAWIVRYKFEKGVLTPVITRCSGWPKNLSGGNQFLTLGMLLAGLNAINQACSGLGAAPDEGARLKDT